MIGRLITMFEEYTFENILARMLDRVPDDMDKREGSVIYDALAPAAVELQLMYIELDEMLNQCFADTADRTWLVMRARERGLEPYGATAAVLKGEFDPEEAEVEGKRFNLDKLNYMVGETLDGGGRAVYCETVGAEGNLHLGTMTPLEYIDGLKSAKLTGIITAGRDEEDTEVFRQRYLESLNAQAFGGNIADYRQKVKALNEQEEITSLGGIGQVRVYCADEWNGGGTVKIVIANSSQESCTPALISAVQEYIDPISGKGIGIAPVGHIVTVGTVGGQCLDVEVKLRVSDGYNAKLLRPYIKKVTDEYFAELNSAWEDIYTGEDNDDITVIVSYLAGKIQAIAGVRGISEISIGGAVFGDELVLDKDCFAELGDLNVEVSG
jgi:uncharacterized phage protein gp47/JayE